MDGEGNIVVLFVPGDHELGEIKAQKALPGFRMLGEEEMLTSGLVKGFMIAIGQSAMSMAAIYLLMFVVLLLRPRGLMGERILRFE